MEPGRRRGVHGPYSDETGGEEHQERINDSLVFAYKSFVVEIVLVVPIERFTVPRYRGWVATEE
jgi:hypothetical protein